MKTSPRILLLSLFAGSLATLGVLRNARSQSVVVQSHEVLAAANRFLSVLRPELRQKATFAFDDKERLNWHFIPRERLGLPLKEMNLDERRAAHALLASALSAQGYLRATTVMSLEAILRELEGAGAETRRDPEKYYFSVFGAPATDKPWGFRVEGHHLSLNFSASRGLIASSAPMMFGANPAEVRTGQRAGLRTLAEEEDRARELVRSLNEAQRKRAIFATEAPRDVILVPGHAIDLGNPAGIPASGLTERQAALLQGLIRLYANNLRGELAQRELRQLDDSNFMKTTFAWAGSLEPRQGHYYRIHAPAFIIEYDNTQNDANHIHAVWHSKTDDFGLNTLREHYARNAH